MILSNRTSCRDYANDNQYYVTYCTNRILPSVSHANPEPPTYVTVQERRRISSQSDYGCKSIESKPTSYRQCTLIESIRDRI